MEGFIDEYTPGGKNLTLARRGVFVDTPLLTTTRGVLAIHPCVTSLVASPLVMNHPAISLVVMYYQYTPPELALPAATRNVLSIHPS